MKSIGRTKYSTKSYSIFIPNRLRKWISVDKVTYCMFILNVAFKESARRAIAMQLNRRSKFQKI